MRLAFAVAAHLEPEILIIDEVLAVGDLSFQNKCLGRMQDVAGEGRTVLFVSHNMGAVANLCTSGLWLDHGTVRARGRIEDVVAAYVETVAEPHKNDPSRWRHHGSGEARVIDARLIDAQGYARATFGMGETLVVEFDVEFYRAFHSITMAVAVHRADTGLPVLDLVSSDSGAAFTDIGVGKHTFSVGLPDCMLYPGPYSISLWVVLPGNTLDHVQDVLSFSMVPSGCSSRTTPFYPHLGVFHAPSVWREA
jgi:lipopolysaccharide transport system ATP-binding protein